jgi:hypothetical protein
MTYKLTIPDGSALHTAGEKLDQEYAWYVEGGNLELLDRMKIIHRALLRDVGGESPRLALLLQEQRIGFLIGDMPSPRRDYYGNRILYNTLYLEFKKKPEILNYFANLLCCSTEEYDRAKKAFTDFSEWLYKQEKYPSPDLPALEEMDIQDHVKIESGKKWALYNNETNRRRCAAYLRDKVIMDDTFCCVVTGRVSIELCKKAVIENNTIKEFLILTLASEMEKKNEISLELSIQEGLIRKIQPFVTFFKRK